MQRGCRVWANRAILTLLGASVLLAPAWGGTLTLQSGINGKEYTVQSQAGTAGTLGEDYSLGTYLVGGLEVRHHGFKHRYAYHTDHFCQPDEPSCFVSSPSDFTGGGALETTDHNWIHATSTPVVVDLGPGNDSDQALVFSSIDHLGFRPRSYGVPAQDLWNRIIEGIEFTVYGSNDFADAVEVGDTYGVFGNRAIEAGKVPREGIGSSFEQGVLVLVFEDGWADFGSTHEGDDYASVWKFSQPYRYIAVYSNFTDPFLGDGFQSYDSELDAVGGYLNPVGSKPVP